MADELRSLGEIIDQLRHKTRQRETVSVEDMIATFEERGFGPLIFVPGLFLTLPTGGIPGAPMICGLLMVFLSAQMILGFSRPWLPGRLRRVTVKADTFHDTLRRVMPMINRVDRYIGPRLVWMVKPLSVRLVGLVCLILSILIIPLGAIPFAAWPPACAVTLFALAISLSDGVLMAAGLLVSGIAIMGLPFI